MDEEDAELVSHHALEEEREEQAIPELEGRFYEMALRIATTPGLGKNELKREEKRIIANFKKEVETAFKLAEARAKEDGYSNFVGLKPGMKNLSFAELPIASITEMFYGPKRKPYLRISLWDSKKETPVLVPKERAQGIQASDRLALRKVDVDFLTEKNEVVLVVSGKSKLIVVK
ncbi:Uncharacterised protein [uncultured archaeon]|nr:Uncharacterised protein [uncultured archaeon]